MKYVFMGLLLTISLHCHSDSWKKVDTVLLSGAVTTLVWDWGQTRTIAKHPEKWHEETNFILGEHPSVGKVNTYFVSAIVGTIGLSMLLPEAYRRWGLGGLILLETTMIIHNHSIGIRASF